MWLVVFTCGGETKVKECATEYVAKIVLNCWREGMDKYSVGAIYHVPIGGKQEFVKFPKGLRSS